MKHREKERNEQTKKTLKEIKKYSNKRTNKVSAKGRQNNESKK